MPKLTFFDADSWIIALQHNAPSFMVGFTPEALKAILESKSQDLSDITLRRFAQEKHLWYRLLNIHFPHRIIEYQDLDLIQNDWQTIFWYVYEKEYKGLDSRQKELFSLAKIGAIEKIKLLKITSKELELQDSFGKTLIYWMARNGCQTILDEFYQKESNKLFSSLSTTKVHSAARYNQLGAMRKFISSKQNINTKDWDVQTPMRIATTHGLDQIVELLIFFGRGRSPWVATHNRGYLNIFKLFKIAERKQIDHDNLIISVVRDDQTEVFQYLINYNYTYSRKAAVKALYHATSNGNEYIIKSLIKSCEDIVNDSFQATRYFNGISDHHEDNAIRIAVKKANTKIIIILIQHGAEVTKQYDDRWRKMDLLKIAIRSGLPSVRAFFSAISSTQKTFTITSEHVLESYNEHVTTLLLSCMPPLSPKEHPYLKSDSRSKVLKRDYLCRRLDEFIEDNLDNEQEIIAAKLMIAEIKSGEKQDLLTTSYADVIKQNSTLSEIHQTIHPIKSPPPKTTMQKFTDFFTPTHPTSTDAARSSQFSPSIN